MSKASERRKRIRVPLTQAIRHSKYQVLGTPVFEENSAVDLSSNGISFETEQDYKRGTLVLLELEIAQEMVKLLVCVAWVKTHDGRHTIGAELIAIDPEHKKAMQSHLNRMIREASGSSSKKKSKKKKKTAAKKKTAKKVAKKKAVKKKAAKKKTSKKR